MTFTPFERELLAEVRRTNELLAYICGGGAFQPRFLTGGHVGAGQQEIPEELLAGVPTGPVILAEDVRKVGQQILEATGLRPMHRPPGTPPTPAERQARWAARAKEVGYSDGEAEELVSRVQVNLDNLIQPPADELAAQRIEQTIDRLVPTEEPAPRKQRAKKAAAS